MGIRNDRGGRYLVLNDDGQLITLTEDGEVVEYIVEYHKGNANYTEYVLKYSDLYRAFSSINSEGTNMNDRENPSDSKNYGWDIQGIINHYINNGRDEGREFNLLTSQQDDIYNEEGFQAKLMPLANPSISHDGRNYSAFWIWKSDMPQTTGGDIHENYFSNNNLMSVPIEVVKFYYDYRNYFTTDINAKLIVQVDDRVDIIHNDRYIQSVKIGGLRVIDNIVLTPGKNRIMLVCRNTGGPAGVRAVLIDKITKNQLMNTDLNWRYIDDLVNIMGNNVSRDGDKLEFTGDEWDGKNQFHYDYVNTTGEDQQLKIEFMFDDYGTVWIDRKLINAKAMNDTTPFYAIVPPGKSHICCEIMNYGGPGKLWGTIKDMQTNEVVLSTEDDGWRHISSNWRPGPREFVKIYAHGNFNDNETRSGQAANLWIGHLSYGRLTANDRMANDQIGSVKVPKMLECTLWKDDESQPKGRYSRFITQNTGDLGAMNDATSMVTVKTRSKDRVYFFRDSDGNNGGGSHGNVGWHIEQKGFSNFHPQLGGESFGNSGDNWNQQCTNDDDNDSPDTGNCSYKLTNINEDQITSLWIPKGFKVKVYERRNYQGSDIDHTFDQQSQDRWENLGDLNDKNSSIKVQFGWDGTKFNVMNDYLL